MSNVTTPEFRKDLINELLDLAIHNPAIPDKSIPATLFASLSGEILIFERANVNLIDAKLEAMVQANHPLKGFILAEPNGPGNGTVQEIVAIQLSRIE